MNLIDEIIPIIRDVLVLGSQADDFNETTSLLGSIPEFDSMAVVSLVAALEEEFDCVFDDDELNADVFSTIGSLTEIVEGKIN